MRKTNPLWTAPQPALVLRESRDQVLSLHPFFFLHGHAGFSGFRSSGFCQFVHGRSLVRCGERLRGAIPRSSQTSRQNVDRNRSGRSKCALSGHRVQGIATAAASAAACAICAMDTTFFQAEPPTVVFSGTTMMSPGPSTEESTPPDHNPLLPLVTEPFARTMKMAFLLASPVAPPARGRYQPAFFPGASAIAFELYTCLPLIRNPAALASQLRSPDGGSNRPGDPPQSYCLAAT